MKEQLLKNLLSALSQTDFKEPLSLTPASSAELKPQQMVTILQRLLGDSVHVINPALSLQASPLVMGPAQAAGVVQYLQALRPLTPLKKPIVMLVAQPSTEQKSRGLGVTVRVNGWRTMVIVPQHYRPPEGKPVGNDQNPLIYYFDPQKQVAPNQAPAEIMGFCQVLIRGCQAPMMHQGRAIRVTVEPVFRQLGFFHGCRALCDETADSGWWALYFAIMAVSYGGVSFEETNALSLGRLRQILSPLIQEPVILPPLPENPSTVSMTGSSIALETVVTHSPEDEKSTGVTAERNLPPADSAITTAIPPVSLTLDSSEVKRSSTPSSVPSIASTESASGYEKPPLEDVPETSDRALAVVSTPMKGVDSSPSDEALPVQPSLPASSDTELKSTGPTEQKQVTGSVYTPGIMAGILRAYQIAPAPDAKLSRDSSGQFELVAYPPQAFQKTGFLQDLLHYWQAKQGRLENRRVAYIISTPQTDQKKYLGLVIQYSAPDTTLAAQCWQEQKEIREKSVSELLEEPSLMSAAPRFYGQVQVTVLGVKAQPALIRQLQEPLSRVFRGQMALSFKPIVKGEGYTLVLTEDILGMLQHGQTRDVDIPITAAAHRQRCERALLTRWTQIEHQDSGIKKELVSVLRTVMILATLQTQRQSRYGVVGEDHRALNTLQSRDQAMKRHLYAQRFPDEAALLTALPLAVLASFLLTSDATEWLKILNQHKDTLNREVLGWERNLQEKARHQRPTPCDWLTKALAFFYHSSFIGLGGEVFRLTARTAAQEGKSENKESKENKYAPKPLDLADFEAKTLGGLVRRLTLSDALARRSEERVRIFLGDEPVSRSLGILGATLGGAVQIALGPYALLQMLGVAALTRQMVSHVQANQIHELTAELTDPAWSITALHRISLVLWHGVEALVLGSPIPLASALGGMAGSTTATVLTQRIPSIFPTGSVREAKDTRTPESGLSSLLICLAGATLGQRGAMGLYGIVISLQHRTLYRDTAITLLSHGASHQPDIKTWAIDTPSFRTSPSFWFNDRNPIRLAWTTQSGMTHAVECEIKGLPILTPTGITGLVCTGDIPATEISTTLGLPRP